MATGRDAFGSDTWAKGGVVVPPQGLPVLPKWSPAEAPSSLSQLWVHNRATHLPQPTRTAAERAELKERSAGLHESLKLITKREGVRIDLLSESNSDALLGWLGSAIPGRGHQLISALYVDEEDDAEAGGWQPCLQMRLNFSDVGFLHELRDAVLTGTMEQSLSRSPLSMRAGNPVLVHVSVDRSQFAAACMPWA